MNTYPMIGISGSLDDNETQQYILRTYTGALIAAGAVPVLLAPDMTEGMLGECLKHLDGVLLSGGNDVAPELFGAEPIQQLGEVNPVRDTFEMRLVCEAFTHRIPTFGICRGIQSMNVAMGGTLWQDLPSQFRTADGQPPLAHSQKRMACYRSHKVRIEKDSLLHQLVRADEIPVNSFHHQAVREAAPCLRITARATDGVIEAVECPSHPFFLGVQWHPERYYDREEDSMALFRAFVQAAREYQQKK